MKNGIFFSYDKSPFIYKGLQSTPQLSIYDMLKYKFQQLLTISMYLNDLILHFGNILVVDQQFRTLLVFMCNKITFVTS